MTTGSNAPRNLVLAGFMGAGKTTVGRLVAARLGWPFVDTDELVEQAAGRSIATIFAQDGEAAFRHLERRACQRAALLDAHVIATGGGALLDPDTRAAFLARGVVVWLSAELNTIVERLGQGAERPLFAGDHARLEALFAARAPLYAALPHRVKTDGRPPEAIAEEIVTLWQTCTS